jgi:hypothetical protein
MGLFVLVMGLMPFGHGAFSFSSWGFFAFVMWLFSVCREALNIRSRTLNYHYN